MKKILAAVAALLLAGCCCNPNYVPTYRRDNEQEQSRVIYYRRTYYTQQPTYTYYRAPKGELMHVAGFDIQQGQQMRDFFDDFEEPMHAQYIGNNTVRWVYYIDYQPDDDEGEIVRYCELDEHQPHSLCSLTVEFYYTYVSRAYTTCY